jgi:hypothetical protein
VILNAKSAGWLFRQLSHFFQDFVAIERLYYPVDWAYPFFGDPDPLALKIASILVEAWDLYSIAFVLVFIREHISSRSPAASTTQVPFVAGRKYLGAPSGESKRPVRGSSNHCKWFQSIQHAPATNKDVAEAQRGRRSR